MPLVDGRGAGLGNEMIVWAKAFVAGQMLGARVLHPAWGLNKRGYSRYFGTPRSDWLTHRALRTALPFFRFDDAQRVRHGGDLEPALRGFAAEHGLPRRGPFVLGLHGMGGGYDQLTPARDFLRATLLGARGTLANLFELDRRVGSDRLRIGFHVRRGDFGGLGAQESYRGRFNVQIPLDWYVQLAVNLARALGNCVSFIAISDATEEELAPLTQAVPCHLTSRQQHRDVSDLLAMASCDFLVCSISSYSLWAAFLSDARYGWYAPNLTPHGHLGSIWGHEAEQQAPGSPTRQALDTVAADLDPHGARGVAIGEDGAIPDELIADLERRAAFKRPATDLLRYGVAPLPDATA
ncbi:alpha-1,2-fucosyltransferase [Sphingomonas sp. NBWT7]|uniref:alpha-1,2-fucosyltransferase n=1 Tax=Sphingomonas sp. NBWT7 TaxID=2596913 RepID=UPI001627CAFF|nr:alpha-1,2-fucosyltransferase [Sphingomonas sp. NBWT7]